ncbi:MAG: FAD-dependent oxidoreductase [Alphaproteobacteria bacterium]|jgi:predicted NAD/FAD-binding protein|nr:FAD-dependent oxidoreductase [Alphaproteobacteria bacterium]
MAKIAIVGSGISGLGAAFLLHPRHDIVVYESDSRIGGHSRTVTVNYGDRTIPVDTGFIVFNERNYPNLTGLFRHLGVPVQPSTMGFAATILNGWLEWGSQRLTSIFAQRRNLIRPAFYRFMRDVMRFNALALATAEASPGLTLAGLIDRLKLGRWFQDYYILPMGGAIWSCAPSRILSFPALTFTRFFANHGLLTVRGQPQWYTVTGGSQEYVRRLTQSFAHKIRTGCGAARIVRKGGGVDITDTQGVTETYDHVILACHADVARELLADQSAHESDFLGSFRFQDNRAVLHRDRAVMPKREAAWASWVYRADGIDDEHAITVSYWMNSLQGIDRRYPLFVTLNPTMQIAPDMIFDEYNFRHPIFDARAIDAQSKIETVQGIRNTWFCGAYLRHGFHEDGLASAVNVAARLGAHPPWERA